MRVESSTLTEVLSALDRQIGHCDGARIGLVVCGGAALLALGLVSRTTRDVDVLATATGTRSGVTVQRIGAFPDWLRRAAARVARDFGLPENWLNSEPAAQLELGLPGGLESRLTRKVYGRFLTIYFIGRLDQIHFKLYAAVDRDDYHTQDLWALSPTSAELIQAAHWVLTQDVSAVFKLTLLDFLKKHGHETVAQAIR
jgi:hypothetical protein